MLISLGQQVDIIEHPVATIVFHVHQTRTLGLDAHVDIFGYQADKFLGILCLQTQGNIDNSIVVGLVLGAVQIGHVGILYQHLVGKDCQRTGHHTVQP